ncbi:MAG: MCE family protein [Betaproteobacteria bacterium]|nr:MCE family protein [Betaproteobacteria bacterium]MDE2123995.1 MCE family protein [Betaproteobacteria bacterium]MDE2185329.1 MCE family protein [Betaproteobacteria bacterium]MDE2324345.1 MCE family protein [Betaproteobacteria bacterium]
MESKINYTAVGVFVVLLGLMLGGAAWWLATGKKQGNTTPYLIFATDNVNGLRDSSNVLYRGVKVGQVHSIEIDPSNPTLIRIRVDIDKNVPVRADTVAQLSPQGVTGLSVLNLSGGASPAPLKARPNQPYPVIRYAPSVFSRLEGGLNDATITLSKIASRLDLLLSNQNIEAIGQSLSHVASLTQTLDAHRQDIAQTLANLRQSSQELAAMGSQGRTLAHQGNDLLARLSKTTQQLQATLATMDQAAESWREAGQGAVKLGAAGSRAVDQLQNRTLPGFDRLTGNLQQLSSQLTELVRGLKTNPSQLLYGAPLPPPGPGEQR